MERLLRRSCLAVAARARSNLRQMLQLEGLQIQETSNGLVVSLMASRQIKSSEQEDWKYTEEPLPSPIALSTKVFKAAEKFRVRFERDLTSLIEEVLQPVRKYRYGSYISID